MDDRATTQDPMRIAGEVCLSEIPATEAQHTEAGDYVMHFCGNECYRVWCERVEQAG